MKRFLITLVIAALLARADDGFMKLPEIPAFRFPNATDTNSLIWTSQTADGRIQTEKVQRFLTIENPAYSQAAQIASVSVLGTNELADAWVVSFRVTLTNGVQSTNAARYAKAPELLVRQNMENQRKKLAGYAVKMGVLVPPNTSTNAAAALADLTGRIRAYQAARKKPGFARLAELTASETVKGSGKSKGTVRIEPATAAEIDGLIADAEIERELNPKAAGASWTKADRKAAIMKITTTDENLAETDVRFVRKVTTKANTNCSRRERVGDNVLCFFDDGRVVTNKINLVRGAPIENPYISKFDAAERRKAREESGTGGNTAAAGAAGVLIGAGAAAALKRQKQG